MEKYLNEAVIGNQKMMATYTKNGELIRLFFPNIDFKQFIDFYHIGVKINDSQIIYLHKDINNNYNQEYIKDTNVLKTKIENKYFNLNIEQIDCIPLDENVLIKNYKFKNENSIDLDLKFLVRSKLLSNVENSISARIFDNSLLQYNFDYTIATFSKLKISSYQIHDVENNFNSGEIVGKDYIGMSNDSAISYDLGVLKPGEEKVFNLFIFVNKNKQIEMQDELEKKIDKAKKYDVNKKILETCKYWEKYVQNHININFEDFNENIEKIYKRSILLFPLLINKETGGIIAAPEMDEARKKCGGYAYCWPRDGVFVTKALDLLKMQDESKEFYLKFCQNTQSKNGMWEQRFFTNGNLAPCWGYQIDETASVIYGIYEHYKITKDIDFLKESKKMCENACNFLFKYIENILKIEEKDIVKKEILSGFNQSKKIENRLSYDIWEMNEGVHLYSLACIYSAFGAMLDIENEIKQAGLSKDSFKNRVKQENLLNRENKLRNYREQIKNYVLENFCDKKQKILYRNLEDKKMDISILGAVYPFNMFSATEKCISNTIQMLNMTLRTYTGGILRFEDDSYVEGKNPWVISTLWMALYYIKAGNKKEAINLLNYVCKTASPNGLLAEQVSNSTLKPAWVIGLGWSHAMFILLLNEL